MRISDTMSESKKQNRQVTVTPEKEHSRILSVSQVSESEWVCDLSGDHGNLDNCSEWNLFKICIQNFESDTFPYAVLYEPGDMIQKNVKRQISFDQPENGEGTHEILTGRVKPNDSYNVLSVHMIAGMGGRKIDLLKPRAEGQSLSDWMNDASSKMLTLRLQSPDEIALALCMLRHERLGARSAFKFLTDDHMWMILGFLKN